MVTFAAEYKRDGENETRFTFAKILFKIRQSYLALNAYVVIVKADVVFALTRTHSETTCASANAARSVIAGTNVFAFTEVLFKIK